MNSLFFTMYLLQCNLIEMLITQHSGYTYMFYYFTMLILKAVFTCYDLFRDTVTW